MEKIHKEILGLMGKVDIDCRDEGGFIIFDLNGQLDIYNSGELEKLVEAYMSRSFLNFIMNLEQVNYLDSSTISTFIYLQQKLQPSGGKLILVHLKGAPKEVFEMAKLHEVFEVFPDVEATVKGSSS